MRIKNTTSFPDDLVREVVRFVRPPGIRNFDVRVSNSTGDFAGRAYLRSGYHDRRSTPFVVVRVGPDRFFPRKVHYRGRVDSPTFWYLTREEALVGVIAHELRHLWQFKQKNRRGYFPRTRGKCSERDCECWALNRLRAWRRRNYWYVDRGSFYHRRPAGPERPLAALAEAERRTE